MSMGLLTCKSQFFRVDHTPMSQAQTCIMLHQNGTISDKCRTTYIHTYIEKCIIYIQYKENNYTFACYPCMHMQATCMYTKSHAMCCVLHMFSVELATG